MTAKEVPRPQREGEAGGGATGGDAAGGGAAGGECGAAGSGAAEAECGAAGAGAAGAPGGVGGKPLLMVDIDGVISLFGFPEGPPWGGSGGPGRGAAGKEGSGRGAAGEEGSDGRTGEREVAPTGSVHAIDGVPHYLSHEAAARLLELEEEFELVWASGWEEKADEYLPHLLGLPRGLAHLSFQRDGMVRARNAHWKLGAIEEHAGSRALAWIDDSFDEECHAWARRRQAPTLLVQTAAPRGLTREEAERLRGWARGLPRLDGCEQGGYRDSQADS